MTPEQHLWIAVLSQAVADATSTSETDLGKQAREDADKWLRRGRQRYQDACHLAGFDPDATRERYLNGTLTHIKRNDRASRAAG